MSERKKITRQQKATLSKIHGTFVHKLGNKFQLINGTPMNTRVINNLISKGLLTYNEDSFFSGQSQTVRIT